MTGQNPVNWLDSPAFILLARVSSVLGTALAACAVWIFLQFADDVKQATKDLALLSGTVRTHESIVQDHSRRIERLEGPRFTRNGVLPAPQP